MENEGLFYPAELLELKINKIPLSQIKLLNVKAIKNTQV